MSVSVRVNAKLRASTVVDSLAPTATSRAARRASFQTAHAGAHDMLLACADDVSAVLESCSQRETFDTVFRNFAAQQAVVLRDQRAWTGRTATERAFWTADQSRFLVDRSQSYVSMRSRD